MIGDLEKELRERRSDGGRVKRQRKRRKRGKGREGRRKTPKQWLLYQKTFPQKFT